jgi:type VI secretion system secreted protein VgrG
MYLAQGIRKTHFSPSVDGTHPVFTEIAEFPTAVGNIVTYPSITCLGRGKTWAEPSRTDQEPAPLGWALSACRHLSYAFLSVSTITTIIGAIAMAMTQDTRFLEINTPLGPDALLLTGFSGVEEISRPFRFQLDLISETQSDIKPASIVGQAVTFGVRTAEDGARRYFNGFVNRFNAGDEDEQGVRRYRAEVVPWLWFLTQTAGCRIFQQKSVPDIIEQVFKDLGFQDYELKARESHPKWDYCVQYRETAFNFVSRLMEQEGFFYFFRHQNGKHTMVIADAKTAYEDCQDKVVSFPRTTGARAFEDHITAWEHRYEFRPGKWTQNDYNFETPTANLSSQARTGLKLPNVDKYEIYEYPGEYEKRNEGDSDTKLRMEAEEAAHDVVAGASYCKSFSPGFKFAVGEHRSASEEGKKYVLTSVRHHALETMAYKIGGAADTEAGFDYYNQFECIPDSVTARPTRRTPKPMIQGVQTAFVVGPKDEEIYPDKHGRVKVQFHWDREGKRDENSSCWIRVSQAHAGPGFGGIDIPRIGQEVIVDFLDGDPDRPIITGRVYNGQNKPPHDLPGEKTISGFKSNTHKGEGHHVFTWDDTAGKELMRIKAQKNLDTTVGHDETHTVKHNRTKNVDVDEMMTIGKNQTLKVGTDKTTTVGANHKETVEANQTVEIAKDQSVTVGKNQKNNVGFMKTETVGIASNEMVGAIKTTSVGVASALTVAGAMNTGIGFFSIEEVGMLKKIWVGENFLITVLSKLEIGVGESKLIMESSGKITLSGKDITIESSGPATLKSGGLMKIEGLGNVDIDGPIIDLN